MLGRLALRAGGRAACVPPARLLSTSVPRSAIEKKRMSETPVASSPPPMAKPSSVQEKRNSVSERLQQRAAKKAAMTLTPKAVEHIRALLHATAGRPPRYDCFGMHEWAMVYRADERRHALPLRLGRAGTDAVVEALAAGRLHGYGTDVTDPEPLPADHPLWGLDNCVITPHTANIPRFMDRRIGGLAVKNWERFAAGETMLTEVDVEAGY